MTVKIIGNGWVGKAMKALFPDALVHDPSQGLVNKEEADVSFVCVPTSSKPDGSLDMSIVEEVVGWCQSDVIVIRSTVNPGTADRLKEETGKRIVSQPEYLGESVSHPLFDESKNPFMVLGGDPEDRRKVIELYQQVYNANIKIRQTTNLEAEVIKLSENRAIAFKVLQAQELYDACEAAGVDYYTIREAVYGDDPRFNLWWTFIYPDKRGANSKCIPKDVRAWSAWSEDSELTDALLKYNERLLKS
jgi:UDPglucose 6-dehydrogenase